MVEPIPRNSEEKKWPFFVILPGTEEARQFNLPSRGYTVYGLLAQLVGMPGCEKIDPDHVKLFVGDEEIPSGTVIYDCYPENQIIRMTNHEPETARQEGQPKQVVKTTRKSYRASVIFMTFLLLGGAGFFLLTPSLGSSLASVLGITFTGIAALYLFAKVGLRS